MMHFQYVARYSDIQVAQDVSTFLNGQNIVSGYRLYRQDKQNML